MPTIYIPTNKYLLVANNAARAISLWKEEVLVASQTSSSQPDKLIIN